MIKSKKIFGLIVFCSIFGMSACSFEEISENIEMEGIGSDIESSVDASASKDQVQEEVQVSDAELQKFTDYFNKKENNGFLRCSYASPEDIDTEEVICSLFSVSPDILFHVADEKEKDAYNKATNSCDYSYESSLIGVTTEELNDFIKLNTGIGFADCKNKPELTYVKDTDSYYYVCDVSEGGWSVEYNCVSGIKQGEIYTLNFELKSVYSVDEEKTAVLKKCTDTSLRLKEDDGNYQVISNEMHFEKGENTFEVDMNQYGEKCEATVYHGKDGAGCEVLITCDGAAKELFAAEAIIDGVSYPFNKVTDLDSYDYNADGNSEIIIVGETDNGKTFNISGFSAEAEPEIKAALEGTDYKADDIKKLLVYSGNSGDKYATYKDAYSQIAYINKMSGAEYMYDIVYTDADDIPELLAENAGSFKLYSFRDDHAVALCDRVYSEDKVFEYSEKKNLIRLRAVDFQKGDYSKPLIYSFIDDDNLRFLYEINSDFLNKEKIESSDIAMFTPGIEYYLDENNNFETGVNIPFVSYVYDDGTPREKVEAKIRGFEDLEYKPLSGKMNYQELMDALGK